MPIGFSNTSDIEGGKLIPELNSGEELCIERL